MALPKLSFTFSIVTVAWISKPNRETATPRTSDGRSTGDAWAYHRRVTDGSRTGAHGATALPRTIRQRNHAIPIHPQPPPRTLRPLRGSVFGPKRYSCTIPAPHHVGNKSERVNKETQRARAVACCRIQQLYRHSRQMNRASPLSGQTPCLHLQPRKDTCHQQESPPWQGM